MALFMLWVLMVWLLWAYRQLTQAVGYQNDTNRIKREMDATVKARVEALELVVAKLLEGK